MRLQALTNNHSKDILLKAATKHNRVLPLQEATNNSKDTLLQAVTSNNRATLIRVAITPTDSWYDRLSVWFIWSRHYFFSHVF
jgi:hypothetical protein